MAMPKGKVIRGPGGRIVGSNGLTDQQAAFVAAMVANGGNATAAAKAAGYATADSEGWRLSQNPKIQAALHAARQKAIGNLATASLVLLGQVIRGEVDAPMPVRVDASKFVMNLAGHVIDKGKVSAPDTPKSLESMTISEMEAVIRDGEERLRQARQPTIDAPAQQSGEAQDADFVDVSPVSDRQGRP